MTRHAPDKEKIIQMYCNDEYSAKAIGNELHMCPDTVRSILRESNVRIRPSREMLLKATDEEIATMYLKQGMTSKQIGTVLQVSAETVLNRLRRHNVPVRPRPGAKEVDLHMLRILYEDQKLSRQAIAEKLNISTGAVGSALHRAGIKVRTAKEARRYSESKGNWKGGIRVNQQGYRFVRMPKHHRAGADKYVPEHMLVWEAVHNRPLPKGWIIHHLNGIKDDNRPENLVAMTRGAHQDLAQPYKRRIRALEIRVKQLEQALENNQLMFNIGEN